MSDIARNTHQEFWRPPVAAPTAESGMAEACRRCGTEFMVGAAFCHICGLGRHQSAPSTGTNWLRHLAFPRALEFGSIKKWFGLPVASLCAFLIGSGFLIVALSMGLMSVHDYTDFEAIQLWRIQWLMAACASYLAAILLKNRKSEG